MLQVVLSGNSSVRTNKVGATALLSNSLTSGMIGCWLMNDGAPSAPTIPADIASAQTVASVVGSPAYGTSEQGGEINCNGTGYFTVNRTAGPARGSGAFTVIALVKPASLGTAQSAVCYGEVTDAQETVCLGLDASGNVGIGFNGIASATAFSTMAVSAGSWSVIGFSQSGQTARRFFKDGTLQSNTADPGDVATTGGLVVGASASGLVIGNIWSGKIAWIYVWNRALSDAEMQSIYSNPYQILQ